jgi:hypothetical protein
LDGKSPPLNKERVTAIKIEPVNKTNLISEFKHPEAVFREVQVFMQEFHFR